MSEPVASYTARLSTAGFSAPLRLVLEQLESTSRSPSGAVLGLLEALAKGRLVDLHSLSGLRADAKPAIVQLIAHVIESGLVDSERVALSAWVAAARHGL